LLNIKKHVDAGTGKEREVAKQKLKELMSQYNITEADLKPEALVFVTLSYGNRWQRQLLYGCIFKVLNQAEVGYYRVNNRSIELEVTPLEAEQIKRLYEAVKRRWDEELDRMIKVFIQKHKLFSDDTPVSEVKLSPEELAMMRQIYRWMKDAPVMMDNLMIGAGDKFALPSG
jgi:hypothetical protein